MMYLLLVCLFQTEQTLQTALADALKAGDLAVLRSAYDKIRPQGPQENDEHQFNRWGFQLLRQGKTDEALLVFQLNVAHFPKRADPLGWLAVAYLRVGNAAQAVNYHEKAFAISPQRFRWRSLGEALAALGDPDRELAYAQAGVKRYDDLETHDVLLATKLKHGRVADPKAAFAAVDGRFPKTRLWRTLTQLDTMGVSVPQHQDGWRQSDYAAAGLNPQLFDRLMARNAQGGFDNLDGVVVVRGNAIIGEYYGEGFSRFRPHDTRSVGKSMVALLAGIAVDRKYIAVKDPVYDYFPTYREKSNWDTKKDHIAIKHLLSMSSGLDAYDDGRDSPGSENYYQEHQTQWLDHVLQVPMAFKPGAEVVYASANYLILGELLAKAGKQPLDEFAAKSLFEPLEISNLSWFYAPNDHAYGAGGMRITPRDMAKIGRLILNKGSWQNQTVVSAGWIAQMTQPQIEGELWGKNYGYGWYHHLLELKGRKLTVISAAGNGGQRIWIMPDLDAVAVVTMGNYNSRKSRQADEILTKYIVPSLLD